VISTYPKKMTFEFGLSSHAVERKTEKMEETTNPISSVFKYTFC
jgi:hypothetical protein